MLVPTPPTSADAIELAEWLELLALTRANGMAGCRRKRDVGARASNVGKVNDSLI